MEKNKQYSWIADLLKSLLIAILLVYIIRAYLLTPIVVDGRSMEPTLKDRDRLIVSKIGQPKRFDIVVFHAPDGRNYIKRIIGLPGERVEYIDDSLYINGQQFEEPYLTEFKESFINEPLTIPFPLEETAVSNEVIPEEHYFVLGDNRRESTDSREIGAIPIDKIVGTSKFIYYPFSNIKIINR